MRRIVGLLLFSVGCGPGGGCGGSASIPETQRIPRAVDVRVTDSGLAFLGAQGPELLARFAAPACGAAEDLPCGTGFGAAGGGTVDTSCVGGECVLPGGARASMLSFEIPAEQASGVDLCFDGTGGAQPPQCAAWVLVDTVGFRPASPGRLSIDLETRIRTSVIPVRADILGNSVVCEVSLNSAASGDVAQDLQLDLQLAAYLPPGGSPRGLRVEVEDVVATIPRDDISVSAPAGASLGDRAACAGFGLVKGLIGTALTSQLGGVVQDVLDEALGTACIDDVECGAGETCGGGYCEDADGVVVPASLGGGTLLSISDGVPGVEAADLAVALAVGPGASADPNGLDLGAEGGVAVVGEASSCLPVEPAPAFIDPPLLPSSGMVDLDYDGMAETSYMAAVGLSGPLMAQIAWAIGQSGLLCAEIGTSEVAQLNTGSLGLAVPSLRRLTGAETDPSRIYPARIALVPTRAPRLDIGSGLVSASDPLLSLELRDLTLQVEVQLDERWIRIMDATVDLDVGLGLEAVGGRTLELKLSSSEDWLTAVSVDPSPIVAESPEELGMLLPTLLELAVPQLLSGLPAIELPGPEDLSGVDLTVLGVRGAGTGSRPAHAAIYFDFALAP